MNHYETVFILTPVLSDVQMKEAVDKFKEVLVSEGAEMKKTGDCANWLILSRKSQLVFISYWNLTQIRLLSLNWKSISVGTNELSVS